MIGNTDWVGISGFIIAIATLIPVLVSAFLQIKQRPKINEVHAAVTPVNGEDPINKQVTETNAIAHDIKNVVENNGGNK